MTESDKTLSAELDEQNGNAVSCSVKRKHCMNNFGHASCKALLHMPEGVEFDYSGAQPAYRNCRLSAILADLDRCERIGWVIAILGEAGGKGVTRVVMGQSTVSSDLGVTTGEVHMKSRIPLADG